LEIAVLVTDANLDEIAAGPDLVVHWPEVVLAEMDEWNTEHHGASGLAAAVRASSLSLAQAEEAVLAFLEQHTAERSSPLCGNTIHQDRAFLRPGMPSVEAYLHYRNIDVSTLKELVRRWYPALPRFEKAESHRALDDIRESIAELRYYRDHV